MITSKKKTEGNIALILRNNIRRRWQLYLLLFFPVMYIIIFNYIPMGGILLAFREYSIRGGIYGNEWVGLKYFRQFFDTPMFYSLIKNSLIISFYSLIAGFPAPILLAISLNEIKGKLFKKTLQTITYAPYFISTVVLVGMLLQVFHLRVGIINNIFELVGLNRVDFMGKVSYFRHLYVWSSVWQGMGFGAVLYIAALSGVDPALVDASIIDGANRIQKIRYVDIPAILPTIVIQIIFAVGSIMSVGFEKMWLMQNPVNLPVSEIISTFVYKRGIEKMQYSYATAVGLFNSVINLVLLVTANFFAKKAGETSLW